MEKSDLIEWVGQSRVFELLDETGRDELLDLAERRSFKPGDLIIREGEIDTTFFMLLEGTVEVLIDSFGEERVVNELSHGSVFGEIAALVGEERSASIKGKSEGVLLAFDGKRMQGFLTNYPKIREVILKLGLKRSEETMQEMLREPEEENPV